LNIVIFTHASDPYTLEITPEAFNLPRSQDAPVALDSHDNLTNCSLCVDEAYRGMVEDTPVTGLEVLSNAAAAGQELSHGAALETSHVTRSPLLAVSSSSAGLSNGANDYSSLLSSGSCLGLRSANDTARASSSAPNYFQRISPPRTDMDILSENEIALLTRQFSESIGRWYVFANLHNGNRLMYKGWISST
jgi:hypothetical protein